MLKTIAKKELYRKLKVVSDDVMKNGAVYVVIQNSKPAFCIAPIDFQWNKKYYREALKKSIFF